MVRAFVAACLIAALPAPSVAAPLPLLDVPFISQSELLCGGAAAAMIMRFWGERGVDAGTFAPLVERRAGGIRTTALVDELRRRGWIVDAAAGTEDRLAREMAAGRPVIALIEDRPRIYHYVVIVGLEARTVVFHDPARAPFRVMPRDEFSRRWRATGRWMAVVVPREPASSSAGSAREEHAPRDVTVVPSCDALVADGVARAQANDVAGAERLLTTALSCPGPAPLRELAGVRVLQRRWMDAASLARAALAIDPSDAYTWQLLATSEFVQDRPLAALDAWNRAGEPRVDLVRADGLERTRHRVVETLIGVPTRSVLTRASFIRAGRQLAELPAASSTRLAYAPAGSGLVELQASVVERPLWPRGWWSLGAIGLSAATSQSIAVATGSLSGGGESLAASWRFWPRRPRLALGLEAPAPFGGTWGVDAFAERQPFDDPAIATSRRSGGRLTIGKWIAPTLRVAVRGGVDRWQSPIGGLATFGGGIRLLSSGSRVDLRGDVDAWSGRTRFATASVRLGGVTKTTREGVVFAANGGGSVVASATPADLWGGGDTGLVRPTLLRAHPLVIDGALKSAQLGRAIVHASGEAQRWWSTDWTLLHVGGAAFVDAARTMTRISGPARNDADVGIGARLSIASMPGVLRVDVAHGLRDGANALSVVYVAE